MNITLTRKQTRKQKQQKQQKQQKLYVMALLQRNAIDLVNPKNRL